MMTENIRMKHGPIQLQLNFRQLQPEGITK
jgi:hypothetical protein